MKFLKNTEAMQFDGTRECADAIGLWYQTQCPKGPPLEFCDDGALVLTCGDRVVKSDWVIINMRNVLHKIPDPLFRATYTPAEPRTIPAPDPTCDMTIGQAVQRMYEGCKVQRKGWNGKGMFLALVPEFILPPFITATEAPKVNVAMAKHIGEDTALHSLPYIAMWTADQKWQPGWVCSQSDLLAHDWQVLDAKE